MRKMRYMLPRILAGDYLPLPNPVRDLMTQIQASFLYIHPLHQDTAAAALQSPRLIDHLLNLEFMEDNLLRRSHRNHA